MCILGGAIFYMRWGKCVFEVVPVGILGGASVYFKWCQCVLEVVPLCN